MLCPTASQCAGLLLLGALVSSASIQPSALSHVAIEPLSYDEVAAATSLPFLDEIDHLRQTYKVDGKPFSVVILDTGLHADHVDFGDRVAMTLNFTADNDGAQGNAADGHGHGTHIAGVIGADGVHRGIAPGVQLIALKVLSNDGTSSFRAIDRALTWVLRYQATYNIAAVNISWGALVNYNENPYPEARTSLLLNALAERRVAVIAGAGNAFFQFESAQGMTYPAIVPTTLSVGATYPADLGRSDSYADGAKAFSTGPDRITPFSQRLDLAVDDAHGTDVFAPGAAYPSSGIESDSASVATGGTSVAAAVVTGLVLLMQEYYWLRTGELPPVALVEQWLRESAAPILDGDDEDDNVQNTGVIFSRIDAVAALNKVDRSGAVQTASRQHRTRSAETLAVQQH